MEYFSGGNVYEEVKARDKFKNQFSWILTCKFGAVTASKFTFDFEEMEGYLIFKVNIPRPLQNFVQEFGNMDKSLYLYSIGIHQKSAP